MTHTLSLAPNTGPFSGRGLHGILTFEATAKETRVVEVSCPPVNNSPILSATADYTRPSKIQSIFAALMRGILSKFLQDLVQNRSELVGFVFDAI